MKEKVKRCKCGHYFTAHNEARERPKRAAYCGSCTSRKAQHAFEEAAA